MRPSPSFSKRKPPSDIECSAWNKLGFNTTEAMQQAVLMFEALDEGPAAYEVWVANAFEEYNAHKMAGSPIAHDIVPQALFEAWRQALGDESKAKAAAAKAAAEKAKREADNEAIPPQNWRMPSWRWKYNKWMFSYRQRLRFRRQAKRLRRQGGATRMCIRPN